MDKKKNSIEDIDYQFVVDLHFIDSKLEKERLKEKIEKLLEIITPIDFLKAVLKIKNEYYIDVEYDDEESFYNFLKGLAFKASFDKSTFQKIVDDLLIMNEKTVIWSSFSFTASVLNKYIGFLTNEQKRMFYTEITKASRKGFAPFHYDEIISLRDDLIDEILRNLDHELAKAVQEHKETDILNLCNEKLYLMVDLLFIEDYNNDEITAELLDKIVQYFSAGRTRSEIPRGAWIFAERVLDKMNKERAIKIIEERLWGFNKDIKFNENLIDYVSGLIEKEEGRKVSEESKRDAKKLMRISAPIESHIIDSIYKEILAYFKLK